MTTASKSGLVKCVAAYRRPTVWGSAIGAAFSITVGALTLTGEGNPKAMIAESPKEKPVTEVSPAALSSGTMVEITSQFAEIWESVLARWAKPEQSLKEIGVWLHDIAGKQSQTQVSPSLVLSSSDVESLMRQWKDMKGVDLESLPRPTTPLGQSARVEFTRKFCYPTKYNRDSHGNSFSADFTTKKVGLALEALPTLAPDGIEVKVIVQLAKMDGFLHYADKKSTPNVETKTSIVEKESGMDRIFRPEPSKDGGNQPIIWSGKFHVSGGMRPDQTVVAGFIPSTPASEPQNAAVERSVLLVFVTPKIIVSQPSP